MASHEPRPLYVITGTMPEMIRRPDGSYEHGYRVSFRTAAGQDSYVIIPRSEQQEAQAHIAIEEEAHRLVNMAHRHGPPTHHTG